MRHRTALWSVIGLLTAGLVVGAVVARPTLTTITVDGDYDDWRRVLANDRQLTWDGDGSSYGKTCAGSFDRDCEVGSTGRDIYTFAWTWDDRALFLYTERVDEGNNARQYFYFLMDLDNDARMQASDRVLQVAWQTNNPLDVALYPYQPVDPEGDPMADAEGWVDGFDPVGTFDPTAVWTAVQPGQSRLAIEVEVPWPALGVPPGSPIKFHVATGNSSTSLGGVLDNCGGPDGRLGTFGFSGVSVEPDHVGAVTSPGTKDYVHQVTNTGNAPDVIDLWATSTRRLALALYADLDGDGAPDQLMARDAEGDGDFTGPADTPPTTWDGDGDGIPDTGLLAGGERLDVVLRLEVPAGYTGMLDTTRLYGRSQADPRYIDHATDLTGIGRVVMVPNGEATGVPGATVRHAAIIINAGDTDDLAELSVAGVDGWATRLWQDTDGDGAGDVLLGVDLSGDGTWEQAPGDTDGDGVPDTGRLSSGAEWPVVLEVDVPLAAQVGDVEVSRVTLTAESDPGRPYTARYDTRVGEAVTLEPDHLDAELTGFLALPGDIVYFPHVLTNNQAHADCFDLGTVSSMGWTVRVWSDPDGDGSISDGEPISSTCGAGFVAPFGGTFPLVVEVMVPDASTVGTLDTTVVRAVSAADATVADQAIDETRVSLITLYRDPERTRYARNFATCTTAYARVGGLEPGQGTAYRLEWIDPLGVVLRSELVPTDGRGLGRDAYGFGAVDPLGVWAVKLTDERSGVVLDQVGLRHERAGRIAELATNQTRYADGNVLSADLVLVNDNVAAPFDVTEVLFTVLTPDGTAYLAPDGTFQPHDGSGLTGTFLVDPLAAGAHRTEGFSVVVPDFPGEGTYTIVAQWRTGCGAPIATASTDFPVVLAPPVITEPLDETHTQATSLPVLGTGEPGATLTLSFDGAVLAVVPVAPDGTWTSSTGPLVEGRHVLTAVQAYPDQLTSRPSAAVHVVVDRTAPDAPVIETPAEGFLTGHDQVEVTGTAEPGARVSLTDGGAAAGTTMAGADGRWSLTLPVTHGEHVVVATASDAAGNVSPPSAPRTFLVDLQAPPAPTLDSPAPGALLTEAQATAGGTAEPGSTVELYEDGVVVATTVADAAGQWSVTVSVPDGDHAWTATATDGVGNVSEPSASVAFSVDATPPAAPVILAPAEGGLVAARPVRVKVQAEPGALVSVFAADGHLVGTGTASETGLLVLDRDLEDGVWTLHATATDAAGHVSTPSAAVTFVVDTVAPATPVVIAPFEGQRLGLSKVLLAGTAEPAATLTLYLDGAVGPVLAVDEAGDWQVWVELADGAHVASAEARDAAGHLSPRSSPRAFVVDTQAPGAPHIASPADGLLTNVADHLVSGTAEAGAAVTLFVDEAEAGTVTAGAEGSWSLEVTLLEGRRRLVARAQDATGHPSPFGNLVQVLVDLTPPPAPLIDAPADGAVLDDPRPLVEGSAEANSRVTVYVDGVEAGSTWADGGRFRVALPWVLDDGAHVAYAEAEDEAGNVSDRGPEVAFEVLTQPVVEPDGGSGSDGGTDGGRTDPSQDARTATPSGCGCSAQQGRLDSSTLVLAGLLGLLGFRRRRA